MPTALATRNSRPNLSGNDDMVGICKKNKKNNKKKTQKLSIKYTSWLKFRKKKSFERK